MARFVAMLRSVNVGGRNRVAMADLRDLVASLGFGDVTTYVQSGNVVFSGTGSGPTVARAIAERMAADLGLDVPVLVRTAPQLRKVLDGQPLRRRRRRPEDGPRHLPGRPARRGQKVAELEALTGRFGARPVRDGRQPRLPPLPGRLRRDQVEQHLPRATTGRHGDHPQLADGHHARRTGRPGP